MRVLVAAVHPSGVIGIDQQIPWHFPADLKRFKRITMGNPIVMGRNTHASIGRLLPGRENRVVTSHPGELLPGAIPFRSLEAAITDPCAVIGGRRIYAEAMEKGLVDVLDICWIPDVPLPTGEQVVHFPELGPGWEGKAPRALPEDARLSVQRFVRRGWSDGAAG